MAHCNVGVGRQSCAAADDRRARAQGGHWSNNPRVPAKTNLTKSHRAGSAVARACVVGAHSGLEATPLSKPCKRVTQAAMPNHELSAAQPGKTRSWHLL